MGRTLALQVGRKGSLPLPSTKLPEGVRINDDGTFTIVDWHKYLDNEEGRKAIAELEGTEDVELEAYAQSDSEKNRQMVNRIRQRLRLTTLKYQKLENLVEAIGLPKEKLCTHCWDGSSYF